MSTETATPDPEILECSCCGCGVRDTPDENVSHGTGQHDVGYGMCTRCGGDKRATGLTEAAVRRRIGWAGEAFYDMRIAMLLAKLSEANRAKFESMSYIRRIDVVQKLILKGTIV